MSTASLELSKELYELSNWVPPEYESRWNYPYPAYDLGYLLRKLAEVKQVAVGYINASNTTATDLEKWVDKYIAYTPEMPQYQYPIADTPEDAVCKLAIELFKQGILK